jgi:hypothetical protein
MSRFAGKKVSLISDAEKEEVVRERRELTGFAADNTERRLFLKCAFRTGDISTVWIDPVRAADLFWHLRKLLRDRPKTRGSPVKFESDAGAKSYGHSVEPNR